MPSRVAYGDPTSLALSIKTGCFGVVDQKRCVVKLTTEQRTAIGEYYSNHANCNTPNTDVCRQFKKDIHLTITYSTLMKARASFDFTSGPVKIVPLIW